MRNGKFKKALGRLLREKKALAIPVTYLILFASLIVIISLTYSFAVAKISAHGALLNASVAKQNMQVLDDAVLSVAWSSGASRVVYMDDCGGTFQTQPTARNLVLNFTDEQTFSDVVFNSSVGKVVYKLKPSQVSYEGLFIRGDYRAVTNQSSSVVTQLYGATADDAQELILSYRPLVTTAMIGESDGKPLNLIRIYIVNLNSSQSLTLREKFYLKVTAVNVSSTVYSYSFNSSVSSLALKATFDNASGNTVQLQISSNANGAVVRVEIVTCNIKIQRAVA